MKSFEQIAKAIFEAHDKVISEAGGIDTCRRFRWEAIPDLKQDAWIAAAKEAHKQITEVH